MRLVFVYGPSVLVHSQFEKLRCNGVLSTAKGVQQRKDQGGEDEDISSFGQTQQGQIVDHLAQKVISDVVVQLDGLQDESSRVGKQLSISETVYRLLQKLLESEHLEY